MKLRLFIGCLFGLSILGADADTRLEKRTVRGDGAVVIEDEVIAYDPDDIAKPCEWGITCGYIRNMTLTYSNASKVIISTGKASDSTSCSMMCLTNELVLDITADLDTGSEDSNTWYHVHVIASNTTVDAVFSASATSPTLPTGFTYFRRVGTVYNDASEDFYEFRQRGGSSRRYYELWVDRNVLVSVDNGTATSWTDLDNSHAAPSTASKVYAICVNKGGSGYSRFRPDGYAHDNGLFYCNGNGLVTGIFSSRDIEYKVDSGGSAKFTIVAYEEEL